MVKSAIKQYFDSISGYPQLTAQEEVQLSKAYKDNADEIAREKLINCNLRLVVSIAKRYTNSHMELMDLISEGNIGLMQAVDKFNPDLGYRFSTCATPWIKQAITKAIINSGKSIRIPAHIYQLLSKYKQTITDLTNKLQHEPSVAQIAAAMNITEEKVGELEGWRYDTVDLDTPLNDDEEDTLSDLQADGNMEGPEKYTERKAAEKRICDAIHQLKPRNQQIIKLRFGIREEGDPVEYKKEHTLDEIGVYVNLTRERVRQLVTESGLMLKNILGDNFNI